MLLTAVLCAPGLFAQTSLDAAMRVTAVAQAVSPVLTLRWPASAFPGSAIAVVRTELKSGVQTYFPLKAAVTSFADQTAKPGEVYQYQLNQMLTVGAGSFYRNGMISAAYDRPLADGMDRVCILVDETMAVELAADLDQLVIDLRDDGLLAVLHTLPRMVVTPWDTSATAGGARRAECEAVKSAVRRFYDQDPASARALILVGHLPVPYSGLQAPDGHPDHYGAWPTDIYYGDLDGEWTDLYVNQPSANLTAQNLPGDGKFDPQYSFSPLELTVGRIDFSDMPSMGVPEAVLLHRYLVRDHLYRRGLPPYADVKRGMLVADNFGFAGGEAFAAVAWNTGTAAFGAANVVGGDWFGTLGTTAYLMAYGNGGGGYQSAAGIGWSQTFATQPSKAVFNLLFGSYFGDWNTTDNFLRAPLSGGADSLGLVSCWPNRPNWDLSLLALNGTIGDTLRSRVYSGVTHSPPVHQAVMGDPTLRFDYIQNPVEPRADVQTDGVRVTWTAHPGGALGYHVYRSAGPDGAGTRLTGAAITPADPTGSVPVGTAFLDAEPVLGATSTYQVRAVFRRFSPSGSYLVLSAPASVTVAVPAKPMAICSVVSRRIHGTAGAFDLPVVAGTVEPRARDGALQLIVRFNQPVVSGSAAVVGSATLRSVALDGTTMTITLAQAISGQWLGIRMVDCVGVAMPGALNEQIVLGVLDGDVDQSGSVNRDDVTLVRKASGDAVTRGNALLDLDLDGWITNADIKLASAAKGGAL